MDETSKRSICRMVAGLIAIDLDVDEGERQFLEKVLAKFGIADSQWDAILPLMEPDEAFMALKKLGPDERQEALGLLLEAATADHHVSEEERDYLETICEAIDVDARELETRLERLLMR